MKLAIVGGVLLVLGAVAVFTGVLPASDAIGIGERVWPILLFVVAITIVAELAAVAGLFDVIGAFLARVSRGRTWALWALVVVLAVVSTAFLSLDTTAVLLTPVVIALARAHRLSPLPFAFATVWLANTASLVLPVSNLTNLLAVHRLGMTSPGAFLTLLGPSAFVAIVVTVLLLWASHRRELRGRFAPAVPPAVADRTLLVATSVVVVILLPLLVTGIPPWMPAVGAAVVLGAIFLWRAPGAVRPALVPWQLVVFAAGLFLVVGAFEALGSAGALAVLAGRGDDLIALWRVAASGLIGSNAINNLPAYLALETVADSPRRMAALLVGVNAGPLITPWASLATLLWHQRLAGVGVDVPWRRYVLLGLVAAPLTVALAVLPLAL
ncbi:SLC13 family permease [Microbacterium sp.]|uniref:SLC13 family permease n=1 Tax=Microbacterium sp. TaxID=51671 RepID=UPI0025F9B875|nr:SLC13 family permease [Microbacterium sp.]